MNNFTQTRRSGGLGQDSGNDQQTVSRGGRGGRRRTGSRRGAPSAWASRRSIMKAGKITKRPPPQNTRFHLVH